MRKQILPAISTLFLAGMLATAPALAGMGGSGGGMGGSGGGMGGDYGSGGGAMMNSNQADRDFGSMESMVTGSTGSGDMTLEIRPVRFENGRLEFKYFANTHSVSLGNYDLMEHTVMEVGGREFRPVKVDPMSGHHARGKMIFELPGKPGEFSIVIRGVPRVEERRYRW